MTIPDDAELLKFQQKQTMIRPGESAREIRRRSEDFRNVDRREPARRFWIN
ncbi:hypothetical protein [Bifidobacterium choloepi]|uniref:hypothetical protein n=1 Tax=Bifidobacterium choloepi TaxID=2614131 RepID=UPI0013D2D02A|nr:hypothetical protein [Bifidobacterium choloepi]